MGRVGDKRGLAMSTKTPPDGVGHRDDALVRDDRPESSRAKSAVPALPEPDGLEWRRASRERPLRGRAGVPCRRRVGAVEGSRRPRRQRVRVHRDHRAAHRAVRDRRGPAGRRAQLALRVDGARRRPRPRHVAIGAPLFIGIARKDDVFRYLEAPGTRRSTASRSRPTRPTRVGAPSGPPSRESIWAASTQGTGQQTLQWNRVRVTGASCS